MKGVITVSKQKDGQDNTRIGFEMVSIELESANPLHIGDPVTSLAVQAIELGSYDAAKKDGKGNSGKGKNQRLVMNSLESVIKSNGVLKYIEGSQRTVVKLDDWRAELWSKMGCTEEDKTTFKTVWHRAKMQLIESGQGGISGGFVWLQFKTDDSGQF
jgi:hypothetical protein